jgi:hypothetical protein
METCISFKEHLFLRLSLQYFNNFYKLPLLFFQPLKAIINRPFNFLLIPNNNSICLIFYSSSILMR